jgi:hypothetical protein
MDEDLKAIHDIEESGDLTEASNLSPNWNVRKTDEDPC